jgi:thymidylate synthase (FAD)
MTVESVNVPPPNCIKVLDDQGWVSLIDHMGTEATICNAARVSFGKFKSELDAGDIKLIKYLYDHKHSSPFEHVMFTFSVHCPLYVRSQWHRHRTWSFNEISRRYTDEEVTFYLPQKLRTQAKNNRQASTECSIYNEKHLIEVIDQWNKSSFATYERLLKEGVCREQARGVLPQNMMTTFFATIDLGNLLKFFDLRDSEHAQYEIRVYAQAIKQLIQPIVPNVMNIVKKE